MGYYDDPHLRPMSIDAMGRDARGYVCNEHGKLTDGNSSYSIIISPREAPSLSSSYHLVGHDLRSSPESLFQKLLHQDHGYDESSPTLFVLECVLMYLPGTSVVDLLVWCTPTWAKNTENVTFSVILRIFLFCPAL